MEHVLTKTQSATLGHLFLLIAVASPLLSGLHSGTLALANLSTWSARTSRLLICACIFVLAASRFDSQLLGFLDMIAALVTPALVIILAADAMAVKPRARHAVAAWLSGAGIALFLKLQGYLGHFVVGAVVSLLLLWILHRRHVEPS